VVANEEGLARALLKIARMGHPVLRRPAKAVADPGSADVIRLLSDMAETLADAGGVGLAAPQVHVPLRIVLFMVPAARALDPQAPEGSPAGPLPLTALINPEITPLGDETESAWEACLSVPGLTGLVPRFRRIRYTGVGVDGAPIARVAEGFHARVVQHECDHLDAMLYPERLSDVRQFGFVDEIQRGIRSAAAEAPPRAAAQKLRP
jgi:peptide deformylase